MKQLTSEPGVSRMTAGFVFAHRRPEAWRRFLNNLKPEAAALPLDLNEWEIVTDLDPGMVDWQDAGSTEVGHLASDPALSGPRSPLGAGQARPAPP